jgi:hypothetical protein
MLAAIKSFVVGVALSIGSFFGIVSEDTTVIPQETPVVVQQDQAEEDLGSFSPAAGGTYRLKTSIGTTDTTITLSSFKEPVTGNLITMTSLASDIGYATVDPQSATRKEFISFTGITQNNDGTAVLTGVSRGLSFQSPFTASSTLRKAHPGQSILILSDSPQLFSEYARRRYAETITEQWVFPTPLASTSAATKGYVDNIVSGGSVSYERTVINGTAGETFATGSVIYMSPVDQEWYKVDNDDTTTFQDRQLGIAQGPGTNGAIINGGILVYGMDSTQTALTPGAFYFISSTAGATSTATTSQAIGQAKSSTQLFFDQNIIDSSVYVPTTFTATSTFTSAVIGLASTTVRVYTTTSTWSKPSSATFKYAEFEMVGGGGHGGDTAASQAANAAGGGGSGAYGKFRLSASQLPSSIYLQVGLAATTTTATNINSTVVTGYATATAGVKAATPSSSGLGSRGGQGGTLATTSATEFFRIDGQRGHNGSANGSTEGIGGNGASNPLGFGGGGGWIASGATSNGENGSGFGSGGGGGATGSAGSNTGGAGKDGVVIVTEYY